MSFFMKIPHLLFQTGVSWRTTFFLHASWPWPISVFFFQDILYFKVYLMSCLPESVWAFCSCLGLTFIKAGAAEIPTCRKPNHQKFGFWRNSDFGCSDLGVSL